MTLLKERNVQLRFTYGHWAGLAGDIKEDKGHELVLTAETIYSEASVDSLVQVLQAAYVTDRRDSQEVQVGLEDSMQSLGVHDAQQGKEGKLKLGNGGVILVAAKVCLCGTVTIPVSYGVLDIGHGSSSYSGALLWRRRWLARFHPAHRGH